ncbi:MAG: redoxin domain-containing protein [Phycisphaerales bacterium]|nr:redoxin domain-containing protein [Phycisphaerales bacterium]
MSALTDGCVQPARGPIVSTTDSEESSIATIPAKEASIMRVQVGREAIDFEASAFIDGTGFKPVRLTDYKGKWIVLCFYPGDFTFV